MDGFRYTRGGWAVSVSPMDKRVAISPPPGVSLELSFDYDDVDHRQVKREVIHLLDVLADHWKGPA